MPHAGPLCHDVVRPQKQVPLRDKLAADFPMHTTPLPHPLLHPAPVPVPISVPTIMQQYTPQSKRHRILNLFCINSRA